MKIRIRLLLQALAESNCEAAVLSAFACGPDGHPAEEVANLFKSEIYRIGGRLPLITFAVLDDKEGEPQNKGNYEVFFEALVPPEDPKVPWKTPQQVYTGAVAQQLGIDFPPTTVVGEAMKPAARLTADFEGVDFRTDADMDDTIGSYCAAGAEDEAVDQPPWPSASDVAQGSSSASAAIPPSLFLSTPTSIVRFRKTTSAVVMMEMDRQPQQSVTKCEPCTCIDHAANHLLWCYIAKMRMGQKVGIDAGAK